MNRIPAIVVMGLYIALIIVVLLLTTATAVAQAPEVTAEPTSGVVIAPTLDFQAPTPPVAPTTPIAPVDGSTPVPDDLPQWYQWTVGLLSALAVFLLGTGALIAGGGVGGAALILALQIAKFIASRTRNKWDDGLVDEIIKKAQERGLDVQAAPPRRDDYNG